MDSKNLSPLDQLLSDLRDVAKGVADQAMVDRGSRLMGQLAVEHPVIFNVIQGYVNKDPEKIIGALGLFEPELKRHKKNPGLHDYLEKMKDALSELKEP